jgi:signal transduction histidine kinase
MDSISEDMISKAILNNEYGFNMGNREALAVHYNEGGRGIIVLLSAYDPDGWRALSELRQIFTISLLLAAVISLLAGHIFSKQLLKPVAQMIRQVNDISSHNLSERIHSGKTKDELQLLATTFNELLDRLNESFIAQRRFISNASHELSTPLTSISSQLQVTLQRERNTEEYQQVMFSVQEDVMQLRELTKSLLEIAKTGTEGSIELNEVRVDEVLFKVMADLKKIDSNYFIDLSFGEFPDDEARFLVFGNSDLLYIAIRNLIENGCKYSPDHHSDVHLSIGIDAAVIVVKSTGDEIPAHDFEQIFQPFYRSSTSAGIPGFGLGLALARRIVRLHKGELEVRSGNPEGTSFTIRLPTMSGESSHKQQIN